MELTNFTDLGGWAQWQWLFSPQEGGHGQGWTVTPPISTSARSSVSMSVNCKKALGLLS
jgi:hypothetical protein